MRPGKCPYNETLEFCGWAECSDNSFCIEKPWVKQYLDWDFEAMKRGFI